MPGVWRTAGALLVITTCLVAAAPASGEPGPGCTTSPDLREVQPLDGGVLEVARIGGSDTSDPDEWDMAYDTWWCNPTTSTYMVTAATVRHRNGNTVVRTRNPVPSGDTVIDPSTNADPGFVMLRETGESGQFPFPVPQSVRITLTLTETVAGNGPSTVNVTDNYPLAEYRNVGGGYFPPFHQADLPSNQFWSQQRHGDSNFQRWAYDLGVERWTGSGWSYLEAGGDDDVSADFNIYGEPVYAMSDGEIIGCNRGAPDNADPDDTVGNEPGGNMLWVRNGRETTLYAHLQHNSIPFELCPFTDDDQHTLADPNQDLASDEPYEIRAGELLGYVGTSGFSRGDPHLHVHVFLGLPLIWGGSETDIDADSRPLEFFDTQVQPRTGQDVDNDIWNSLDPAAQLPYNTFAKGDACGEVQRSLTVGAAEAQRVQTSAQCFGDVYNTMVYRGMRMTHIDVTENGDDSTSWTTVWRPRGGLGWTFYYGIGKPKAKQLIGDTNQRLLEIESYRSGGKLRFALLFVSDPQAPKQFAAVGQTAGQFGNTFGDETDDGLWPAMISVAEVGDVAYISTVYEKAKVGGAVVQAGLHLADYADAFNDNAKAGRSLAWIESHVEDGEVRLAAIWYENLTGPYTASGVRSLEQIRSEAQNHVANGAHTRSLTGWRLGDGPFQYLGLWRWPPESGITSGPPRVTKSRKATFKFKRSDPFATSKCKLDGKAWRACKSPEVYTDLTLGDHTFRVRARSREGIVEPVPASASWKVNPGRGG